MKACSTTSGSRAAQHLQSDNKATFTSCPQNIPCTAMKTQSQPGRRAASSKCSNLPQDHLAALKAHAEQTSAAQPAYASPTRTLAQSCLHLATADAQQERGTATQGRKLERDMFGVAADGNDTAGFSLGLMLMRPASSLL